MHFKPVLFELECFEIDLKSFPFLRERQSLISFFRNIYPLPFNRQRPKNYQIDDRMSVEHVLCESMHHFKPCAYTI